jgi:two-component system, cell cycle response regulator
VPRLSFAPGVADGGIAPRLPRRLKLPCCPQMRSDIESARTLGLLVLRGEGPAGACRGTESQAGQGFGYHSDEGLSASLGVWEGGLPPIGTMEHAEYGSLPQVGTEVAAKVGRVLIADDDDDFRALLVRRSQRMGLDVRQVNDGPLAIDALRTSPYDVLVVDLYMPGSTGLEVVQEARRIDPDLQSIILTASATLETALEALRAGVYDYLLKPLESVAAFELSLTRALEHRLLIRENQRLFAEVQRLAVTDPVTGLYNRHKLNETLDLEIERAHRYRRPLSLIMIDMDRLKDINDTYGHPAGDEALRTVAAAILSQVRRVDLATRYGGDEFAIILPEASQADAQAIAQRITTEIGARNPGPWRVSASFGVTTWEDGVANGEELISRADRALYASKRARGADGKLR